MRPRISVCNLGVEDLARARAFYEGMGFEARPESGERAVFFALDTAWLALFPRPFLHEISGTSAASGTDHAMCLSYFCTDMEEVDSILNRAVELGGTIVVEPHTREEGRSGVDTRTGYFADPDGYRWEVTYSQYWYELAE